ncbi:MAG: hypothetical protein HVN34_05490 [Methanobacteriaceae archaeon]|jgi:hypothetical protein|nr:hypothetical protein [Methanobacteriaceae archaeon]OPY19664.1 MAG: hypothetical protein A4E26_02185 [Methanobacterium sp. PtaU1.Bin097]
MSSFIKHPLLIIVALIIIGAVMYPVGLATAKYVPAQNPKEIAILPIGDTVTNGTAVVDSNKVRKVPIVYHPEYLVEYAKKLQIWEIYSSLVSGATPIPIKNITGGGISDTGKAEDIKGPGMLTIQDNKLTVTNPTFVWGYKEPYTVAVKTKDGVDIKQGNTTIRSVAVNDFNNETIPHDYMSLTDFKNWYNSVNVGNSTALDYSLSNFNDGRNTLNPDEIAAFFGESVFEEMKTRPLKAPITVYEDSENQVVISSTSTAMSYYAEYDNTARAHNANQLINAWNNTIIPPHTVGYGSSDVSYYGVFDPDPNATYKWASHGVCPPGRVLRAAALGAGLPAPAGTTGDYQNAIAPGIDIVTGIKVENTRDYPVKIVMWSDGGADGAGMTTIYAQIIELR